MCVPKSKSTFRLESFASTDEATRLILFTVTKSLLHPNPPIMPDPDTGPHSLVNLDGIGVVLEDTCNCDATGKEQGPPAEA